MSIEIIAVLVSIPSALVALIALIKMTGIGRTVKNWATGIPAVGGRIANAAVGLMFSGLRAFQTAAPLHGQHGYNWQLPP